MRYFGTCPYFFLYNDCEWKLLENKIITMICDSNASEKVSGMARS